MAVAMRPAPITKNVSTYVDVEVDLTCPHCQTNLVCPACNSGKIDYETDAHTALHWFRTAVQGGWHVADLRSKVDGPFGDGLVAALEVLRDLGVRP